MALFLLEVTEGFNEGRCLNEGCLILEHKGDYPASGLGHFERSPETTQFFEKVLHERAVETESFIGDDLWCPSDSWTYDSLHVTGVRLIIPS